MNAPVTLVRTDVDQAFRKALVDVAPVNIRPKMREALANGPSLGGRAHTERYFGNELQEVMSRAVPLAEWLDREFSVRLKLPGLIRWLDATGFGNDYRMIKALDAWAQMATSAPKETVH